MPYVDPQRRREWDRRYKRAWRARRKVERAAREEQERLRVEREADLRARSLVPLRLLWPLEFADRTYTGGEIVWVLPGTAHLLERAGLAERLPTAEPITSVRGVVPGRDYP